MNNLKELKKAKKQQTYFLNMLTNKHLKKVKKKYDKKHQIHNSNNDFIFPLWYDEQYTLTETHNKINWYKYYLELYFTELLQKYYNVKYNKINLQ